MKHCLIFSLQIFYVTIVLCLNIPWLKTVNDITSEIKVCNIEYLTTQIELVLPTFRSWTVHKIIEYLTLGPLSSLWNIYHGTTAYFFDPPCSRDADAHDQWTRRINWVNLFSSVQYECCKQAFSRVQRTHKHSLQLKYGSVVECK